MYASLLISLLSAFIAMLAKQWINRYLRNPGASIIDRCEDRQRKFDGLGKWSPHLFATNLLVILQISLLLLVCGLCRYTWSINHSVASTIICFIVFGVAFYAVTVVAGTLSYASPFQTPASIILRTSWRTVRRRIFSSIIHSRRAFSRTYWIRSRGAQSPLRQSLQATVPFGVIQTHQPEPWMEPGDLVIICQTNANDARCVSWVLRNITDPEVLDAAIRLAGTIRWFDSGIDTDPPYGLIVSIFEACFLSTRKLYPGSRDRAYQSGQAVLWINTLEMCKPEDLAIRFPLPDMDYVPTGLDDDLRHLLQVISVARDPNRCIEQLLRINPGHTPLHSQWISNLLLHYSWANQNKLDYLYILDRISETHESETTIPLEATLNRLLVWCIFLGSPVEKGVLKIQDKSYNISCLSHLLKLLTPHHQRFHGTHPRSIIQSSPFSNQWHPHPTRIRSAYAV